MAAGAVLEDNRRDVFAESYLLRGERKGGQDEQDDQGSELAHGLLCAS